MKVTDWLCKLTVRTPILLPLTIPLIVGSASPFSCTGTVWRKVWQCETSVGLAQGCSHHREFPSLILHKLHIKLLQHLFFFFFPDLNSLNKGGDLYGKGMRSVSPCVVPWVSHHHMIFVTELKMLTEPRSYPSAAYGSLGETSERWPHDTTCRPNHRRTRVRNWYIWKKIKHASRGRQYIKKKEDRGHICLWKGKNAALKITSREIIYHCSLYHFFWQRQMAWSQIGSLLAFFGIFACCVFCVYARTHIHTIIY